ncbi:hypothetical protein [Flectobacillus sp. BAB-3569]|uniref:hypothetical protein n=1 Tax=Flectobacillus sp. BAB-3569 TaxID=1509483 RepID=UPI00113FE9FB|nr:hypothetical protein [Flectobacillus sp. BAB-3569]
MPEINNPTSVSSIASWLELIVSFYEESLSKATLSSYIEESSGDEPEPSLLDNVWSSLTYRQHLYGQNSPFSVESREIVRSIENGEIPFYLMFLLLEREGNNTDVNNTAKLFEQLSCIAVKNYMNGEAIIHGFPKQLSYQDLASKIGVRYNFAPAPNFKDRGVDIIGWKPFLDERGSHIVGLFQCAAGSNWKSKLTDVPLHAWKNYLSFCDSIPFKGFITPHLIESDNEQFFETSLAGGVIMDRPRLYRFLYNSLDSTLKGDVKSWCEEKIKSLR